MRTITDQQGIDWRVDYLPFEPASDSVPATSRSVLPATLIFTTSSGSRIVREAPLGGITHLTDNQLLAILNRPSRPTWKPARSSGHEVATTRARPSRLNSSSIDTHCEGCGEVNVLLCPDCSLCHLCCTCQLGEGAA
jgi:hypothetical protein